MYDEAIDILNNLMCNISVAYQNRDWEFLEESFKTAVWERKEAGLPPYKGSPNICELEK